MGIARFGVLLELVHLGCQMRHTIAQQSAHVDQAGRRKRRVELHNHIQQIAGARAPRLGAVVARRVLDRLVHPGAALAPRHAQQPAIVQPLQQMIADIQIRAPALDAAMVEMRLHVLGVGETMLAYEGQHLLGARLHRDVPGVPGARRAARMQQGQGLARQETIVNEESLFDRQARIAALQLAGAIVFNAVREDQILGASGRPHRVGLDKPQARNGPPQASGLEKAAHNHVAAKVLETGGFETAHAWRPVGARIITPNLYLAQYSSGPRCRRSSCSKFDFVEFKSANARSSSEDDPFGDGPPTNGSNAINARVKARQHAVAYLLCGFSDAHNKDERAHPRTTSRVGLQWRNWSPNSGPRSCAQIWSFLWNRAKITHPISQPG